MQQDLYCYVVEKPAMTDKLKVLSVGSVFAEAIQRIHTGESVSTMFT